METGRFEELTDVNKLIDVNLQKLQFNLEARNLFLNSITYALKRKEPGMKHLFEKVSQIFGGGG